jgi:hypothetical protein
VAYGQGVAQCMCVQVCACVCVLYLAIDDGREVVPQFLGSVHHELFLECVQDGRDLREDDLVGFFIVSELGGDVVGVDKFFGREHVWEGLRQLLDGGGCVPVSGEGESFCFLESSIAASSSSSPSSSSPSASASSPSAFFSSC